MKRYLIPATFALLLAPVGAFAQAVDTGAIQTDRPTKSNVPYTVPAGSYQYESDAADYTYSNEGGVTRGLTVLGGTTLKYGVSNKMDVELTVVPLEVATAHLRATNQSTSQAGVGDTTLRVKYNVYDARGLDVTLLPFVKLPTAAPGIGNKGVEEGLIVPVSYALPKGFTLTVDPEVDALKDANGSLDHGNYQATVNVSHNLFLPELTGFAELAGGVNNDPSGVIHSASFDVAAAYLLKTNLQLDAGVNAGLNEQTPAAEVYFGVSQKF